MGTKDFTDWNGRKRKETLYPPKEKPVRRLVVKKKDKPAGLKTKVDRYKSELSDLRTYWDYYRRERPQSLAYRGSVEEAEDQKRRLSRWEPHWDQSVKEAIRKLRRIEEDYKKQGIWDRVLKSLKGI